MSVLLLTVIISIALQKMTIQSQYKWRFKMVAWYYYEMHDFAHYYDNSQNIF